MDMVARQAGVSRPTVSLVLNDRADALGISAETKQRVIDVAAELGYRRNELVRAVNTGKNRRLGFLAYNYQGHNLLLLAGAMKEATAQGYVIEWHPLKGDVEGDLETIHRCIEQRLPAVMAVQVEDDQRVKQFHQELAKHQIAMALMDSSFPHSWGVRVITDDEDGMRQAVQHLADLGHRKIAFLAGDSNSGSSVAREGGYHRTMHSLGLETRLERAGWNFHFAEEFVVRLLQQSTVPTAIICANDELALLTMRVARQMGFPCPERLSVVGYANLARTELADPPLTTIEQPFEEMGRLTVLALIERLQGKETAFDKPEEICIPVRMILRGSTAPPQSL